MLKRVVTIEREIGVWGTKLKADLEVGKDSVKLIKGYVKGFTGINFSLGGQSLGFGISDWDFWITEEDIEKDSEPHEQPRSFKVYINFRRIHFFIFNERQTLLIGEYKLDLKTNPSLPA